MVDVNRRDLLQASGTVMLGAVGAAATSGTAAAHSVGMPGMTEVDLNIRDAPGLHGDVLKTAQAETGVVLIDGPWDNDGYEWWELKVNACDYGGRVIGYAAGKYIAYRDMIFPASGTIESGDVYYSSRDSGYHRAVDINGDHGWSIKAAESGDVDWTADLPDCGKSLKIRHGNGYYTLYCHCGDIDVVDGEHVVQGEHIANMGTTGNAYSWDPHVHFEVEYPEHTHLNTGAEVGHHVYAKTGIPDIDY